MRNIATLLVLIFVGFSTYAQQVGKKYKIRTVGFYNLENLFDTENDPDKNDEASPIMEMKGDKEEVYWDKIDKLGEVISQLGEEKANTSPQF